ncbi:MAG: DUF1501 domain-containing protein, partial [Planctomycetaceae bacterium]|nr:DUF1501 domain-containing protein [Planctomycetaceae bacterium]
AVAETLRTGLPGTARSCILVYLLGGPPHLDTFDPKPLAPAEVRGPFGTIATSLPGVQFCEHLPRLAAGLDRYSIIRSVSHRNSNHTPMIYYTLTGRHTALPEQDNDVRPPQRTDFPHIGSVVTKLKGTSSALPGYIAIPEVAVRSSLSGEFKRVRSPLRGGSAGFLGAKYDPLMMNGEPGQADAVSDFVSPGEISESQLSRRASLLSVLEGGPRAARQRAYQDLRDQALILTGTASSARQLFTLEDEPAAVRERYGAHRFGKALLVARRLAEAGVPLIAVHFNEMTICDGWDTHSKNFEACQSELLPMLDQGMSALIEDLDARGRLDETLVLCQGEFGRTPKINSNAGRDHWGPCSSTLLAGGGIAGGIVHGASDAIGGYPLRDLVDPVDVQATLYHCLGLDPRAHIRDQEGRPWEISTGRVLTELL